MFLLVKACTVVPWALTVVSHARSSPGSLSSRLVPLSLQAPGPLSSRPLPLSLRARIVVPQARCPPDPDRCTSRLVLLFPRPVVLQTRTVVPPGSYSCSLGPLSFRPVPLSPQARIVVPQARCPTEPDRCTSRLVLLFPRPVVL